PIQCACHHVRHSSRRYLGATINPVFPCVQYLPPVICKHLLFWYLVMIYNDPLVSEGLSQLRCPATSKVGYDMEVTIVRLDSFDDRRVHVRNGSNRITSTHTL